MTMPYKLAQPGVATELHPGDHVTARLRVSTSASVLDQIDVTAQAKPDYKPEKFYNVPAPGQAVPNFKFLNQSGKTICVEQFRGKVIAGHLHLHPLSVARLLHPHEPQLRHHPTAACRRPRSSTTKPIC